MSRWPGSRGDHAVRWPGQRQHPPKEPPSWFRCFAPEDWAQTGDDEVRYPAGALMGAEEVARRRWMDARRQWARDNGFSVADWLGERRAARRRAQGWDP
jgi:hypothetical protein